MPIAMRKGFTIPLTILRLKMMKEIGFYAKTILPSNPSGFEQETNQAYAQQLGISERLGALLNSSRSFGMYISQRAHPDTVKKYRQRILDGFDAYGPESKKEQKID